MSPFVGRGVFLNLVLHFGKIIFLLFSLGKSLKTRKNNLG